MAGLADAEMVRTVRREMARHQIDTSETQVGASHGVVHLYGRVRPVKGMESHFEQEVNTLLRALRQRPGVRDVVFEWTVEGMNLGVNSKMRKH